MRFCPQQAQRGHSRPHAPSQCCFSPRPAVPLPKPRCRYYTSNTQSPPYQTRDGMKIMLPPPRLGDTSLCPAAARGHSQLPRVRQLASRSQPRGHRLPHAIVSSSLGSPLGGKALQETFASGTLLLRWHGVRHLRHQPSHGCREDFLFQHTDKLEDSNPQHMSS